MTEEITWWAFMLTIIGSSLVFGFCIGYVRGRGSMLSEVYGRRRQGVVRRAWRRLDNAVKESRNVLDAEVIE